jgi:hypothetical protein
MNIHLILAGVFALTGVGFVFLFQWMKRKVPENGRIQRDMLFLFVGMIGSVVIWELLQVAMPIMENTKAFWGYDVWDVSVAGTFIFVLVSMLYSMWRGKTRTPSVLNIGFAIAITICIIFYLIVAHSDNALNDASHQYADAAIKAVCSDWDMKELEARASPEFMSAMKDVNWEKTFALFRRLGRLRELKGFRGEVNDSATVDHAKAIVAVYVADAKFEAGLAEIKATCIKHGAQWQVMGFHVTPKVFLPCP